MHLTAEEILLVKDQKGRNGSFYTALMHAIRVADTQNRALLSLGFPKLVEAVNRFQNEESYWQDVCRRWNESHLDEQVKP